LGGFPPGFYVKRCPGPGPEKNGDRRKRVDTASSRGVWCTGGGNLVSRWWWGKGMGMFARKAEGFLGGGDPGA